MNMRSPASVLSPPTKIAPARFETTVYEVRLPRARISQLEAPALESKAATAGSLAKALGEFGDTQVLYKVDQTVNLCGETIRLGTQKPVIAGTRVMPTGQAINTVTYQEVGLIVKLAANPPPVHADRGSFPVQLEFELSVLEESGIEIAPSVPAFQTKQLQLSHGAAPHFGKAVVLLSVSAGTGSDQVFPTAYVIRYVFHKVTD
ncbi:MAG: hypothetical protein H7A46_00345 [Verrucomicrobiales bacterium]|nr:hypothetical protein [Verrucomicrobiales bacterium]